MVVTLTRIMLVGLLLLLFIKYGFSFSFLLKGPKQMVISSVETGEFTVSINLTHVDLRKHMINARSALKTIIPIEENEDGYLASQLYASEVIDKISLTILKANKVARMYEKFEVTDPPEISPAINYRFLENQFLLMELAFSVLPYSIKFDKTNNPERSENITTNLLLAEIFHQTELLDDRLGTLLDSLSEIRLGHPVSIKLINMIKDDLEAETISYLLHDSYTLIDMVRKAEVLYATIQFSSSFFHPKYITTLPIMYKGISLPFNIYIDKESNKHHFLHCINNLCQESFDNPECLIALDTGNINDIIQLCPRIQNEMTAIFEEEDLLVSGLSDAEIYTINTEFDIKIEKQPAVLNLMKEIRIRGHTYDIFDPITGSTAITENTVKYSMLSDDQVIAFTAKPKLSFEEYVREHIIFSVSIVSIGSAFISLNFIKCLAYICHRVKAPRNYKKAVYEFVTNTIGSELRESTNMNRPKTRNNDAIIEQNALLEDIIQRHISKK